MKHLIDQNKPVPFTCQDCIHIDVGNPFRCKAFDLIPEKIFGENHKKVVKGQRGDYVFETKAKRRYERVYVWEGESN